jgi:hypothetical protein
MSNVSTTHPDYDAARPAWTMCRDVKGGAAAVKAKGELYLPKPAGQNAADYIAYKRRGALFGALARTITALRGAILTRPPIVENAPADMTPQFEDATLRDQSLEDVASWAVEEVLTTGRAAIMLDMAEGGGRPYWCLYTAEDVINWRTGKVGDDPAQLVQVVLREDTVTPTADGFGHDVERGFRELALAVGDEGPVLQARVWRQSDPALVVSTANTPYMPGPWVTLLRRGKPLSFIPLSFIGPSGVTPEVAKPPLEDLAEVILGHYRNSCDLEHLMYYVGMPVVWASGVPKGSVLKIGSSVAWMVADGGKVGMNEMTGAGAREFRELMAAKEKQMAVLGGRLLLEAPNARPETATSARLRYSAEASSLHTISVAVGAAMTRVLRWHIWWLSTDDALRLEAEVRLSDEFFAMKATPEEVRTALMAVQAGEMSFATFYALLARGGWTRPGVSADEEKHAIHASEALLLDTGDVSENEGNDDAA